MITIIDTTHTGNFYSSPFRLTSVIQEMLSNMRPILSFILPFISGLYGLICLQSVCKTCPIHTAHVLQRDMLVIAYNKYYRQVKECLDKYSVCATKIVR